MFRIRSTRQIHTDKELTEEEHGHCQFEARSYTERKDVVKNVEKWPKKREVHLTYRVNKPCALRYATNRATSSWGLPCLLAATSLSRCDRYSSPEQLKSCTSTMFLREILWLLSNSEKIIAVINLKLNKFRYIQDFFKCFDLSLFSQLVYPRPSMHAPVIYSTTRLSWKFRCVEHQARRDLRKLGPNLRKHLRNILLQWFQPGMKYNYSYDTVELIRSNSKIISDERGGENAIKLSMQFKK